MSEKISCDTRDTRINDTRDTRISDTRDTRVNDTFDFDKDYFLNLFKENIDHIRTCTHDNRTQFREYYADLCEMNKRFENFLSDYNSYTMLYRINNDHNIQAADFITMLNAEISSCITAIKAMTSEIEECFRNIDLQKPISVYGITDLMNATKIDKLTENIKYTLTREYNLISHIFSEKFDIFFAEQNESCYR